jgi:hypothetical protein
MKQLLKISLLAVLTISALFGNVPINVSSKVSEIKKIAHGERDWPVLLVEFNEDEDPSTTGRGTFLQSWTDIDTAYTFDPVPHNKAYFHAHLKAINHYWETVTNGKISVKSQLSQIYPNNSAAFQVPQKIRHYHRPHLLDSLDHYLAGFVFDAVSVAYGSGDFPQNAREIIIYHAGVGQDFDFSNMFDPTPYDMPSFHFDEDYLQQYLTTQQWQSWQSFGVKQGIVLPEMQNQLGINIALNGTEILLSGFLLGLPPLYNTETGKSAAGIFGLMDQGSNNAAGLLPVNPSAFERYLLGISDLQILPEGVNLLNDKEIGKIKLSDKESFLIEYRQNAGVFLDSLHAELESDNYLETITEYAKRNPDFSWQTDPVSGVFIGVNNYDITIPASAFLIWHITDPFWEFQNVDNPNGAWPPMLRLEEADGAYDIGKNYGILSGNVNSGWKWDMWFANNPAFRDNNPWVFSARMDDSSNPNTRSFAGISTGITIRNFKTGGYQGEFELILENSTETQSIPRRIFHHSAYGKSVYTQDSLLVIVPETVANQTEIPETAPSRKIGNPLSAAARLLAPDSLLFIHYNPETSQSAISILDGALNLVSVANFPVKIDMNNWAMVDDALYFQNISDSAAIQLIRLDFASGESQMLPVSGNSPVKMAVYQNNLFWSDEKKILSWDDGPLFILNKEIKSLAILNDQLFVGLEKGGFQIINLGTDGISEAFAEEYSVKAMIPAYLNSDKRPDLLTLIEKEGRAGLAIFDENGILWNNFPIYKNHSQIRLILQNNEPVIFAYHPDGFWQTLNLEGEIRHSQICASQAKTLFIDEQGNWFADGSAGFIGEAIWGFERGNALGHSALLQSEPQYIPHSTEKIVQNGLVYNYPNPVKSGITRFRFFAQEQAAVTISIFSLAGVKVHTIESEAQAGQWNEIEWHIGNLPSGPYFAKIELSNSKREETYIIKPAILR